MTAESSVLYNALEAAIGKEPTRLLMNRIDLMGEPATKKDLDLLADQLRAEFVSKDDFAAFQAEMRFGFDKVDERFDQIDERFEKVDERFDKIDAQFEKVDERFDKIDAQFEKVDERFDKIDAQFEKIDEKFVKIDDGLFQFHETLRGYSRTFITTQAASIVGAVGLAVAMIKLL